MLGGGSPDLRGRDLGKNGDLAKSAYVKPLPAPQGRGGMAPEQGGAGTGAEGEIVKVSAGTEFSELR